MKNETLGQYVDRIIQQKNLTVRDVEERCKEKLTNSYISRIIKGKVKNPTLQTMLALAVGLDVDPYEVFSVAYGKGPKKSEVAPWDLVGLLQDFLKLSPKHKVAILEMVEFLRRQEKQVKKKPRKK